MMRQGGSLLVEEANLDLDVLAWWKARDHDKKADPTTGHTTHSTLLSHSVQVVPGY